jgi:hypothetical protein
MGDSNVDADVDVPTFLPAELFTTRARWYPREKWEEKSFNAKALSSDIKNHLQ